MSHSGRTGESGQQHHIKLCHILGVLVNLASNNTSSYVTFWANWWIWAATRHQATSHSGRTGESGQQQHIKLRHILGVLVNLGSNNTSSYVTFWANWWIWAATTHQATSHSGRTGESGQQQHIKLRHILGVLVNLGSNNTSSYVTFWAYWWIWAATTHQATSHSGRTGESGQQQHIKLRHILGVLVNLGSNNTSSYVTFWAYWWIWAATTHQATSHSGRTGESGQQQHIKLRHILGVLVNLASNNTSSYVTFWAYWWIWAATTHQATSHSGRTGESGQQQHIKLRHILGVLVNLGSNNTLSYVTFWANWLIWAATTHQATSHSGRTGESGQQQHIQATSHSGRTGESGQQQHIELRHILGVLVNLGSNDTSSYVTFWAYWWIWVMIAPIALSTKYGCQEPKVRYDSLVLSARCANMGRYTSLEQVQLSDLTLDEYATEPSSAIYQHLVPISIWRTIRALEQPVEYISSCALPAVSFFSFSLGLWPVLSGLRPGISGP